MSEPQDLRKHYGFSVQGQLSGEDRASIWFVASEYEATRVVEGHAFTRTVYPAAQIVTLDWMRELIALKRASLRLVMITHAFEALTTHARLSIEFHGPHVLFDRPLPFTVQAFVPADLCDAVKATGLEDRGLWQGTTHLFRWMEPAK